MPPRSTNRLVKLPSVRKPSASREEHFERARGRRAPRRRRRGRWSCGGGGNRPRDDRQRRERHLDRLFGRRLERAQLDRQSAAARQREPHLARPGAEGRGLEVVARLVAVEGEIERLGAGLHPGEMAVEIDRPRRADRSASSRSGRSFARRHKSSLRQAFAPFVAGLAVRDDAGAEPEPRHASRPRFSTKVRIATLNAASPSGASLPIAPQ